MKEEQSLGALIKESRKIKNISQKDLAIELKTSQQSIANWENDKNKPDTVLLQKLCESLDLNFNDIKNKYYSKKIIKKTYNYKKIILSSMLFLLIISSIISIGMICLLIKNRNKVYVYTTNINDNFIKMTDTIFIETSDNYILKLGNIVSDKDDNIRIKIYYKKDNKDRLMLDTRFDDDIYIMEHKGYNEYFDNDFNIKNNIWIDIYSEEKDFTYTYELTFNKIYEYEDIFPNKWEPIGDTNQEPIEKAEPIAEDVLLKNNYKKSDMDYIKETDSGQYTYSPDMNYLKCDFGNISITFYVDFWNIEYWNTKSSDISSHIYDENSKEFVCKSINCNVDEKILKIFIDELKILNIID